MEKLFLKKRKGSNSWLFKERGATHINAAPLIWSGFILVD